MRKIPTVFVRDAEDRRFVTEQVDPGCEWVLAGEGEPTRKYDGTCVMFDGTRWWARREVKPGKPAPEDFALISVDEVTKKSMGWEPAERSSFAKAHAEAVAAPPPRGWEPGTYELVGPKVNGNPERAARHELWAHAGAARLVLPERTFELIRDTVRAAHAADGCEGVVWHHPDGRMAKIKARDFPANP